MTDIVDRKTRSRMMSGIPGRNTKPELTVRSFLHRAGLRFRLHRCDLPGRPDIVLPRYRVVVLVHGCFWHRHNGCRFSYLPDSNRQFWLDKFQANVDRDKKTSRALRKMGWRVLVVWECSINETRLNRLVTQVRNSRQEGIG